MARFALPFAFVLVISASLVHGTPHANAASDPRTVTGVVVSDEGVPLEGADVYGYSYSSDGSSQSNDHAIADAKGAFTPASEGK